MAKRTEVSIENGKFKIDGEYTYKDRSWQDISIEGMLLNTRMVQGIFDDKNQETVNRWAYSDTGKWDAARNNKEFIKAMPLWKEHGVLCFTMNLQGGNPKGYAKKQPWVNSAFLKDGSLDEEYMNRMEKILDRADELGMVVILGYFYFGQDDLFLGEEEIKKATKKATKWILNKGYSNVIIELVNECDLTEHYTHQILTDSRIHELINLVKKIDNEDKLLVSTSFRGGAIPTNDVIKFADFILIHGNGIEEPTKIGEMVQTIKEKKDYWGQPILFNEDDHFDFDKPINNMLVAIKNGVSWGYLDLDYQSPPINWGINTDRKKAFFALAKEVTGY